MKCPRASTRTRRRRTSTWSTQRLFLFGAPTADCSRPPGRICFKRATPISGSSSAPRFVSPEAYAESLGARIFVPHPYSYGAWKTPILSDGVGGACP
jgi:hypothetical protein